MHNCIIYSNDPSLIGMLIMRGHGIHYTYDMIHLLEYVSISQPDSIIIDTKWSHVAASDILRVTNIGCRVIIRSDDAYPITDELRNKVYIFPTNTSDEELVKKISDIYNPSIDLENNKTVLIIEDSSDLREMYTLALTSKGYTVHSAADGLSGIAKAGEVKPGIILLDIMMPYMDGFEVLATLNNNTNMRPTIIVNSNLEGADEEKKVKEMGADYFMRKSQYTPMEVVDFIEKNIYTKK